MSNKKSMIIMKCVGGTLAICSALAMVGGTKSATMSGTKTSGMSGSTKKMMKKTVNKMSDIVDTISAFM